MRTDWTFENIHIVYDIILHKEKTKTGLTQKPDFYNIDVLLLSNSR